MVEGDVTLGGTCAAIAAELVPILPLPKTRPKPRVALSSWSASGQFEL